SRIRGNISLALRTRFGRLVLAISVRLVQGLNYSLTAREKTWGSPHAYTYSAERKLPRGITSAPREREFPYYQFG
ncbi:MAG: hypothetical protein KI786_03730, partial [Mameliella sp.]|nr:hypothetical protein [Phaeodactylibacter sp.]